MTRMVAGLNLKFTEDDDQLYKNFDVQRVLDDSGAGRHMSGRFSLTVSQPDTQVLFSPEVTNARWIVIQVRSGEVRFKFNNTGSQPFSLGPIEAAGADALSQYQKEAQPGCLVLGKLTPSSPVTTLYMSNPSATETADVTILVIGEAA